jgi:signal transduction histidine kinase
MCERAARIGARLDIASGPGEGTRVEVQVPAAVAYRPRTAWWRRRMGRRRG